MKYNKFNEVELVPYALFNGEEIEKIDNLEDFYEIEIPESKIIYCESVEEVKSAIKNGNFPELSSDVLAVELYLIDNPNKDVIFKVK